MAPYGMGALHILQTLLGFLWVSIDLIRKHHALSFGISSYTGTKPFFQVSLICFSRLICKGLERSEEEVQPTQKRSLAHLS